LNIHRIAKGITITAMGQILNLVNHSLILIVRLIAICGFHLKCVIAVTKIAIGYFVLPVILCVLMRKFRDQLLELHKDRGSRERDE
jgi:hypothetical protein